MRKPARYALQQGLSKVSVLLLLLLGTAVAAVAWTLAGDADRKSVAELAEQGQPLAAADALSNRLLSSADLPPEGTRSLFDHLMAASDGLPWPFEKLVANIASWDAEGRQPQTLMIPKGRSLLKGQADFHHPRLIVAANHDPTGNDAELAPIFRGRLFLGFVEDANEIEVISYNELAGRYEFQLVKDYREGGIPKITYAKRAICTTCHTNQATIFPVRPWQETNAQPAISQRIVEAQPDGASHYHGAPLKNTLEGADTVDQLTDLGNSISTTQRIWLDGCGEGTSAPACRSLMLELGLQFALNPGSFNPDSAEAQELRRLQCLSWPADGIVLANNDLPNRNPLEERSSWLDSLRGWFSSDDSELSEFEKLPPLPPLLDPLTPRPHKAVYDCQSLEGIYGLGQLFGEQDLRLINKAAAYKFDKVREALRSQPVQALFSQPAPFSRVPVLRSLLPALGSKAPTMQIVDTSDMSEPLTDDAPPLEYAAGSVLEHYEKYCFSCHRGNPAKRLNFMAGPDEATVLEEIAGNSEIREVLDYERYANSAKASKLMPPRNSYQRQQLEAERSSGNDPLPEMVEAVPSLFDF